MFSKKIVLTICAGLLMTTKVSATDAPVMQSKITVDPKETVIFVDADDVQSQRYIIPRSLVTLWKAKGPLFTIIKNKPFTWPSAIMHIYQYAISEAERRKNFALIEFIKNDLINFCKENGYGDLSPHIEVLLDFAFNVYPIKPIFALLKHLKDKGFTLVTATNQHYADHEIYKKKMKEHGVDLDEFFSAYVTTGDLRNTAGIFRAPILKPDDSYFQFLNDNLKNFNSKATNYVFIDDKKENIDAAEKNGIPSAHFALHDFENNTYKRTKNMNEKNLELATEQLKGQLIDLAIDLN